MLHRIHETLLYLVEDDDTEGQKNTHEDETVYEPAPADEFPCAEEPVFECFKYRGYWIETHELVYRDAKELHAFGLAQRINDRRGVHPE